MFYQHFTYLNQNVWVCYDSMGNYKSIVCGNKPSMAGKGRELPSVGITEAEYAWFMDKQWQFGDWND